MKFQPNNESNLYIQFLNEIKNSLNDIIFCSLNYDLLFELAGKSLGLDIEYFDKSADKLNFLKLHGSPNFLPPGSNTFINCNMQIKNSISFSGIKIANCDEVIRFCQTNDSISPIMAIYMANKPIIITSDEIHKIQNVWNKYVVDAEQVLIIGVKPNPDDKHIWDSLSQTEAKIGYVGYQDYFNNWVQKYRKNKNYIPIGSKWEDCFNESIKFLK